MSGCLCIRWPGGALSFQRFMLRRVLTAAVGLCRGVYVFIERVKPVLRYTLSSGLCSGVCRQPQWAYVGVFMYSLAGWRRFYSILFPADYAPACADSRSGLMSGCLCIHWPGGADSTIGNVSYNSRAVLLYRPPRNTTAGSLCIFNRNVTASQSDLYPILHARHYPPT